MTKSTKFTCPRCESSLTQSYPSEAPQCIMCGWVDYSFSAPVPQSNLSALNPFRGQVDVLRYVGEGTVSKELTCIVREERRLSQWSVEHGVAHRTTVLAVPSCPWCGEDMARGYLSGKRQEKNERRYKCPVGHRISIVPNRDGGRGWR